MYVLENDCLVNVQIYGLTAQVETQIYLGDGDVYIETFKVIPHTCSDKLNIHQVAGILHTRRD